MKKVSLILCLLMILGMGAVAQAQAGVLTYGDTVTGRVDSASPQVLYSFNGNADDIITAYAIGWGPGFQPTLLLLGPTGQLAFSNRDALNPLGADARITVRLPAAGSYSLIVGSTEPVESIYTVSLQAQPVEELFPLTDVLELILTPEGLEQVYGITANPASPIELIIENTTPGVAFNASLTGVDGSLLGAISAALPGASFVLPAAEGQYILRVSGQDVSATASLVVRLGAASASTGSSSSTGSSAPDPLSTEEVSAPQNLPAGVCVALSRSGGAVNVRQGPGTDSNIVASLPGNDFMTITGVNNDWYFGNYRGTDGWVSAGVVRTEGPCTNLTVIDVQQQPQTQPSVTPAGQLPGPTTTPSTTPTQDNNQGSQVTPTLAPPTMTPTATATPTSSVQIAPPDADSLAWAVDRDAGGQFSDAVSFPDGDTTDRIRMTVNNLSNNPPNAFREFNVVMICNGTNTGNLRWGTGGPNSLGLSCGASIRVVHTNDSNQTFFNVAITGGDPSYVSYTLVATRLG